jgi:hypothetical protein
VYGCGGSGPGAPKIDAHDGATADAGDVPADGRADLAPDAADALGDGAGDRGGDGSSDRRDVAGDVAVDARDGGGADADGGKTDGGGDVAAPTCSDQIKNSDETDVDCGGHCGKCGADKTCLVGGDCSFGICRADHTCGACGVAADCPGAESECQHRSCTAGVCGIARDPVGTAVALQTSGDCKSRQCAADGTVASVNDNTDLPDDRNPCTNDFCMVGVPSHTMLPVNSTCGGLNKCNATGQCVGCVVANDCPGTDTVCQTRACSTQGICSVTFVAAGTVLADPTAGDCKGLECDGAGNPRPVTNNTDLPVDGNPCTTDECSAGTPSHRPVNSGTTCGTGLVCDGANHCVQCLSASTCTGSDTECHTRTCINGACGISNTIGGTTIAAQVPRDCKRIECDGQGGTFTVPDITDLPVDNNLCTSDLCNGDVPSNPAVTAGTNCGGTSVCDGNKVCVGCLTAATCPGMDTECHTRTCNAAHLCGLTNAAPGKLLLAQTTGDCLRNQCDGNGNPETVNDDTDIRIDGNACTRDLCMNGTPSNPNTDPGTPCGTGLICDGTGACVGCVTVADCPGADTACQVRSCGPGGQCVVTNRPAGTTTGIAQTPGDCQRNQCNSTGTIVSVADDTDLPVDGNQCTQDLCVGGLPSNPPEPQDTACAQGIGTRCNGILGAEACVQCNNPGQCTGGADTECRSRTCSAAGVCGLSLTTPGTIVSSQTPGDCKRNQCAMNGDIVAVPDTTDVPFDGNGCTQDLCTGPMGSTPSHLPENLGTPCTDNGGSFCDGANSCVGCNFATDCPGGPDTECHTRVCSLGTCSIAFTDLGTPVAAQTDHDCHLNVCDGMGVIFPAIDDTDKPVDGNQCTQDLCSAGSVSNPPVNPGTTCDQGGGSLCNSGGDCVQCLSIANCDNTHDTACSKIDCVVGACIFVSEPENTLVADTTTGDCHSNVCIAGIVTSIVDEGDLPVNTSECVVASCSMAGVPSTTSRPHGYPCTQNGGRTCDGAVSCLSTFSAVRVGDGSAALTSAATQVFVEERLVSSGALVSTSSTYPLPSTASGSSQPFVLSGTADSEGVLTLSTDGHYLTLIGYATTIPTAAVKGAPVPRVIARMDASFAFDTTTTLGPPLALAGDNARSAVTQDGTAFWVAGNASANANRGVWYTSPLGQTAAAGQLSATNSTRVCNIFFGRLYCVTTAVFGTLGATGVPVPPPSGLAPAVLPGFTGATSLFGFAMFDLVPPFDGGPDTIYVADERLPSAGGGVQKWMLIGGTWSLGTGSTFNKDLAGALLATGVHGLSAIQSGSTVILIGTTIEATGNRIVEYLDANLDNTGSTLPSAVNATWIQTVPMANEIFRGVAFSPHL